MLEERCSVSRDLTTRTDIQTDTTKTIIQAASRVVLIISAITEIMMIIVIVLMLIDCWTDSSSLYYRYPASAEQQQPASSRHYNGKLSLMRCAVPPLLRGNAVGGAAAPGPASFVGPQLQDVENCMCMCNNNGQNLEEMPQQK